MLLKNGMLRMNEACYMGMRPILQQCGIYVGMGPVMQQLGVLCRNEACDAASHIGMKRVTSQCVMCYMNESCAIGIRRKRFRKGP